MLENWGLLLSCEHAGNRVPAEYAHLFRGRAALLATHRGYDIGILPLARKLAGSLQVPLLSTETTRLLVEANRSPHNRRSLFSEFTRDLPLAERRRIVETWHAPHWEGVRQEVAAALETRPGVLHIALHSFTPELRGARRTCDFGLLYDPRRVRERSFCLVWKEEIAKLDRGRAVRRNYPYPGVMDGLTTAFRKEFSEGRYAGIELEVNQGLLEERGGPPADVCRLVLGSLQAACRRFGVG